MQKKCLFWAKSMLFGLFFVSSLPFLGMAENDIPAKSMHLRGTVVDEKANPLMGVSVLVESTYQGAVTNQQGEFMLLLKSGEIRLKISFIGYETQIIHLHQNNDTSIHIAMQPSTVLCDEVIISASHASGNMPLTTSILSKEELQSKNADASLPYLIELEPSVVSTAENGTQVGNTSFRLRGTDASRINVNINGIPLNDAESQAVFWVNIPNLGGMSQSVQIQRGTGASTGGTSAFGGAINIQTLAPAENPFAMVDLAYGSFNTFKASVLLGTGMLKHGFSVDASYTKLLSDGYIRNGNCDHQSLFLSLSRYGKRSLFKFITIMGNQVTGITWNGTPSSMLQTDRTYNYAGEYYDEVGNVYYYDNETDNYKQKHFQLYFSYSFTDQWTMNLAANYTHGYGYYENYMVDNPYSAFGLKNQTVNGITYNSSDVVLRKLMDPDFYVGVVSAKYENSKIAVSFGETFTFYDGIQYGKIIWTKYNQNISNDYKWYENKSKKLDATSFVKVDWNISKKVLAYADIQYRYVNYHLYGTDDDLAILDQKPYIYHFFNPKIGFTFQPSKSHKLYFLAGMANREPTRADLKDASKFGAKEIPKHETLLDLELGYGYNPTRWTIAANLFFMAYKDQLASSGRLNDVGYPLMENVDKSFRVGIELSGGVQIVRWLKFDANLTLSQNKILNYIYYEDTYDNPDQWNPLPQTVTNLGTTNLAFSPDVVGAAIITVEPIKRFKIQLTGKYVGEQYFDNTSRKETRLDDYFVMNGKLSYLWLFKKMGEIEFQFLVNNILNAKYVNNAWGYTARFNDGSPSYAVDGYFPQPGINFMGRIVFKL